MSNTGKKAAAEKAIDYIKSDGIIGVGTGSTTQFFIEALADIKHKIEGAVPSSSQTEKALKACGIPICDLNHAGELSLYVDGADEFNEHGYLIKGGGGALTREKIIASAAKQFVCIVDETKKVDVLGKFPLAIEVIPMARSVVGRRCLKLGGNPTYREGFKTDNANIILDLYDMDLTDPPAIETALNNMPGIVENGLFAHRRADILLIGESSGQVATLKITV